jgi:hypothetical protein
LPLNLAVRTPLQNDQYGYYCIDDATSCAGDNRDTIYSTSDLFLLGTTDSVIVYGINHALTGKATYSNCAIYDVVKLLGVAAIDSTQYGASAAAFVPADPNVAKLYAWTFARDCTGNAFCTAIPTTCPGIANLGGAVIATRAYLEPSTKTRPLATELILDQAIHIKP